MRRDALAVAALLRTLDAPGASDCGAPDGQPRAIAEWSYKALIPEVQGDGEEDEGGELAEAF